MRTALLSLLALSACTVADESRTSQALCSRNPDTCPNQPIPWAVLRQSTLGGAASDYGVTAHGDALVCDTDTGHRRCQLTIDLLGGWLIYTCTDTDDGLDCDGAIID